MIEVYFSCYTYTPPMVWYKCNEEKSSKHTNIFQEQHFNPLWRIIPSSTIFPKDQITFCSNQNYSIPTDQQILYRHRFNPGYYLPNHLGIGTNRNQYTPPAEWCFSISGQPSHLSQSHDPTALPATVWDQGISGLPESPRPTSWRFFDETSSPFIGHLRSGYQGHYRLWSTTKGPSWIQSQKTRAAFLPTSTLLRRQNRRCLGRDLSSWRYAPGSPHYRHPGKKPSQTSHMNTRHPGQSRFSLLRPYDHRIHPKPSRLLCHRGPDHQTFAKNPRGAFLSGDLFRSSSIRIRISAYALEDQPAFYCSPPPYPGKTILATLTFQVGGLYLSSDCYQSLSSTASSLAVLQSEGHWRVDHTGTTRSLYVRKNSQQRLGFQSGLFPFDSFGLQPNPMVPTALPSPRMAIPQPPDDTQSFIGYSSSTNSTSGSSGFKSAKQLSLYENFFADFEKYQKIPNLNYV